MTWADIPNMTYQQAGEVFMLRVILGGTWRYVAEKCSEKWDGDWDSNQMAGMDLCEYAAKKLEISDYMSEPWN